MEHTYKNVTFAADRNLLGLIVIVKQAPTPMPHFGPDDIKAVVGYFNANIPTELAYPANYPPHRANFTIVTEAMVRNALEAAALS